MTKKKKIIASGLLGFLFVILLTLVFLPVLTKNYIINNSKELIGRPISLDQLKINYFTGTLSVFDFQMFETDNRTIFATFDTLIINTIPYKYVGNVIALDQFYLKGLTVNLSKKDSTYNFDDLLEFYTAEDSTGNKTDSEDFKYSLNNLELNQATLHFYDVDVDQTTSIEDFSFFVPQIYWDQKNQSNAELKFNIADGGYIESVFNVHPKTGSFDGKITLNGLQLNSFYKYATQYAQINVMNGTLDAVMDMQGNIDSPKDVVMATEVIVNEFEMKDTNNQTFLSMNKVTAIMPDLNPMKNSIIVQSLKIDQPYVKFELDSISNNYFRIFDYQFEDSYTPRDTINSADTDIIDYEIYKITVDDGIMNYTDNLTGRPFNYNLSKISATCDSIRSDSEWIDINSDMLLNNRGTLKAEVGLNPMDIYTAQMDIAVENFLLSDLNLYSDYYTGHSILEGDMFYFSDSKLTNGEIESSNHLLIKNVDVNNNEGGLYPLPLKFAVWLLKDKNGDIELDVPVAGDLNDPEIDTWALVWTTLRKKLLNTTKNPVIPLARYIGAKPEDIESIAFNYPDTAITEDQSRQIDLIMDLENKKNGLEIEMTFLADTIVFNSQVTSQNTEEFNPPQVKPIKSDGGAEHTESVTIPADSINAQNQTHLDSLIANYSNAIIRNVKKYVFEKRPLSQISVQKAKLSNKDNIGSQPQIKLYYSMKDNGKMETTESEEQ